MKIGVVGKPSSGKSTFLNAATLVGAEMAEHPFTTIKPNLGTGFIRADCPCESLDGCCNPRHGNCKKGVRFVPVSLVDVAGLVPGAHEGKGMGNQFLSDLADADALIHVVDASGLTDGQGNKTENYDPRADVRFLEGELDFWMLGIIKRKWDQLERQVKMKTVEVHEFVYGQLSGLKVSEDEIKRVVEEKSIGPGSSDDELLEMIREIRFRNKPIAVAANKMDLPGAKENYELLKKEFDGLVVPCCAEAELALRKASDSGLIDYLPGSDSFRMVKKMPSQQAKALEFIRNNVLEEYGSTGIQDCLDKTVRDLLGMIVVYPVEDESKMCDKKGVVLPDAFLLKKGSTALDLAYKVHSDIGDKFVGAIDCKTGKRIGKETELKEGDVVKILV